MNLQQKEEMTMNKFYQKKLEEYNNQYKNYMTAIILDWLTNQSQEYDELLDQIEEGFNLDHVQAITNDLSYDDYLLLLAESLYDSFIGTDYLHPLEDDCAFIGYNLKDAIDTLA